MLLLASSLKLVVEIALFSLIGQGIVGLLAGAARDTNLFYRLFKVLTEPFVRGARWVAPRVVVDRHVPIVAFVLLGLIWIAATAFKIRLCIKAGVNTCQ